MGMGATMTMAYLIWPKMYVVHVGDSRCYMLRDAHLQQITTDHTYAEEYVKAGVLKPEEARKSQWSHVLWNVVGGKNSALQPVVYRCELREGDRVLVCTDGVTRHLDDNQLTEILLDQPTAKHTCKQLIRSANEFHFSFC